MAFSTSECLAEYKYQQAKHRAMDQQLRNSFGNVAGLGMMAVQQQMAGMGALRDKYGVPIAPSPSQFYAEEKRPENRPRTARELLQSETDKWLDGIKI